MRGALGDVLPLALAVTISPIPIVGVILLLFSDRPKLNAASYVIGFAVGVAGVLAVAVAIATTQDLGDPSSSSSTGAAWLKIGLGALLVVGGIRRLRNRPAEDEATVPRWMSGIETFSPVKSAGVGFAIGAVNPKNLIVGVSAAVILASASLDSGRVAGCVVGYTIVAVAGVAAPLVVAVTMGDRATALLESWKGWLSTHNAAVMAVLLLVIGALVLGKGVATLP